MNGEKAKVHKFPNEDGDRCVIVFFIRSFDPGICTFKNPSISNESRLTGVKNKVILN